MAIDNEKRIAVMTKAAASLAAASDLLDICVASLRFLTENEIMAPTALADRQRFTIMLQQISGKMNQDSMAMWKDIQNDIVAHGNIRKEN